jgi:hypothetical protein
MDDQVKRSAVAKPDGREVADISRREATDAQIFSEHDHGRVDEAEAKVAVSPVNCDGARELIDGRRRIRERPAREIVDENGHRRPLFTKEVVDFGQHQSRHISSSSSVDGLAKALVIGGALYELVE